MKVINAICLPDDFDAPITTEKKSVAEQKSIQDELDVSLLDAAKSGDAIKISELLKAGAWIHTADFMLGSSPIHYAALEGHSDAIKLLLDNGADIDDRDKMYATPLHCAASEGHENAMRVLLESKANICAKDKFGYTPLHLAVMEFQVSAIMVLLEYAEKHNLCVMTQFDLNGQTPLSALLGIYFKKPELEESIQNKIFDVFKILFSVKPGTIFVSDPKRHSAKSAFQRLLTNFEFHLALKQAILDLVFDHLSNFTERELFHLAFHLHERPTMIKKLEFFYHRNPSCHERNPIPKMDLSTLITRHFHPNERLNFKYFFENFPIIDIWRIFVDGYKQINESGWQGYEKREPGCINSMYQAWKYIQSTIHEPITIEYIKKVHSFCSVNIVKSTQPGEFRTENYKFGANFSFNGYFQFSECFGELAILKKCSNRFFEIYPIKKDHEIVEAINEFIEKYHSQLKLANDDPFKILKAIIEFCCHLEILHPFPDCNLRTFCILILNRELIRQGFLPVLLENPNRLDGYSFDEIVYEVLSGMNDFELFKETKQYKNSKSTLELVNERGLTYPISELRPGLEKHAKPLITVQFNSMKELRSDSHQDSTLSPTPKFKRLADMHF